MIDRMKDDVLLKPYIEHASSLGQRSYSTLEREIAESSCFKTIKSFFSFL